MLQRTLASSVHVTGVRVGTIEHIMSALSAMGIDNVLIELNAPEIPIMDGSSLPFIYLLQDAGILDQAAEKKFIRIKKTIVVEDPNKRVAFLPYGRDSPCPHFWVYARSGIDAQPQFGLGR